MRGVNDDELPDFVALTRDRPLNVRFIEYMPFDGNRWSGARLVPYAEMLAAVRAALPAGAVTRRAGEPRGEVAKNFDVAGHRGGVSFVTSMTHAFCGDCNRWVEGSGGCKPAWLLCCCCFVCRPPGAGPTPAKPPSLNSTFPLSSTPPFDCLQPAPARRRQPQGLPLRLLRGLAARRDARRRLGRGARLGRRRGGAAQARGARGHV